MFNGFGDTGRSSTSAEGSADAIQYTPSLSATRKLKTILVELSLTLAFTYVFWFCSDDYCYIVRFGTTSIGQNPRDLLLVNCYSWSRDRSCENVGGSAAVR